MFERIRMTGGKTESNFWVLPSGNSFCSVTIASDDNCSFIYFRLGMKKKTGAGRECAPFGDDEP